MYKVRALGKDGNFRPYGYIKDHTFYVVQYTVYSDHSSSTMGHIFERLEKARLQRGN
jgi:hypothetical protein